MDNKVFFELVHSYRENKLAHAFLLETNNPEKCYNMIRQFLKLINCPKEYKENCHDCNLCHLIDTFSLPSLITIYPDGINIKKEQILDLKKAFQTKPVFSKYNMYIIMGAENLNASSANTMLKFLEEPEDNILGFFITNNKENVIDTIKSRCQILLDYYETNSSSLINDDYYDIAINYIVELESAKIEALLYNKDVLLPIIKDKNTLILIFKNMLFIYQNVYFSKLNYEKLNDKNDKVAFLLKKDSNYLLKKIELILKLLDELNYNLNLSLVIDRFVLESGD